MKLVEAHHAWKAAQSAKLAEEVRERLGEALSRYLPGVKVWVYGSLVKPGRFNQHSDVDLAVSEVPAGMTIEYLQSLLSRDVGREVDVCALEATRLKELILSEGEQWTR